MQLQEKRHIADYDSAFVRSRTNAIAAIDLVRAAFNDWRAIRTQDSAQDYLLQLFSAKDAAASERAAMFGAVSRKQRPLTRQ